MVSFSVDVGAEFWARYIRFLEPGRPEAAKDAMRRAQGVHCKTQPEMQLLAARFHERHGDAAAACAAYELVTTQLAPGLVSAVLAFANFERRQVWSCHLEPCICCSCHESVTSCQSARFQDFRVSLDGTREASKDEWRAAQGNKEAACRIYDDAVAAAAEKGSPGDKTYAFLVVSYAHFLMQAYKDVDAARSLYATALQRAPSSLSLWEGAIHLEESVDAPVRTYIASKEIWH